MQHQRRGQDLGQHLPGVVTQDGEDLVPAVVARRARSREVVQRVVRLHRCEFHHIGLGEPLTGPRPRRLVLVGAAGQHQGHVLRRCRLDRLDGPGVQGGRQLVQAVEHGQHSALADQPCRHGPAEPAPQLRAQFNDALGHPLRQVDRRSPGRQRQQDRNGIAGLPRVEQRPGEQQNEDTLARSGRAQHDELSTARSAEVLCQRGEVREVTLMGQATAVQSGRTGAYGAFGDGPTNGDGYGALQLAPSDLGADTVPDLRPQGVGGLVHDRAGLRTRVRVDAGRRQRPAEFRYQFLDASREPPYVVTERAVPDGQRLMPEQLPDVRRQLLLTGQSRTVEQHGDHGDVAGQCTADLAPDPVLLVVDQTPSVLRRGIGGEPLGADQHQQDPGLLQRLPDGVGVPVTGPDGDAVAEHALRAEFGAQQLVTGRRHVRAVERTVVDEYVDHGVSPRPLPADAQDRALPRRRPTHLGTGSRRA